MKAMVKDKIKDNLPKSILTYGTYYSLESSINFLISGVIDINGIHEYVKPNVWGLIVLFHNYIAEINAGFDTRNIQKILKLRVLNKVNESEKLMEDLPDDEKGLLRDIFNSSQTPQIRELTELMKKRYKKEMVSFWR